MEFAPLELVTSSAASPVIFLIRQPKVYILRDDVFVSIPFGTTF
jgi:hypothetical protein